MKLVACKNNKNNNISYGLILNDKIYLSKNHHNWFDWFKYISVCSDDSIKMEDFELAESTKIKFISPIPKPNSFRDAYAFRKHVEAGRKSRGLDMIPEYDQFPVYYYSNHNAFVGPGIINIESEHMKKLDFELEIAAIIGKQGKNIKAEDADSYILGYCIMNDFSSRYIQKKEMKLSLGPAKGKDFATAIGPFIVTKNELESQLIKSSDGSRYNLKMKAYINDKLVSEDNFKNISWTFAQIISRISYGTTIFPGDVIGSGTCATGCLLELNQTAKTDIWLKDKDTIRLEVDKMGSLENIVRAV